MIYSSVHSYRGTCNERTDRGSYRRGKGAVSTTLISAGMAAQLGVMGRFGYPLGKTLTLTTCATARRCDSVDGTSPLRTSDSVKHHRVIR